MKNIPNLLLLSSLIFFCISCCDDGMDCCNPNTSKMILSEYLIDWLPYSSQETITFKGLNSNQTIHIDNLIVKDSSYLGGDECPERPAEFRSGKLFFAQDSLIYYTEYADRFIIKIDKIEFGVSQIHNKSYKNYYSINKDTHVEMFDSLQIINQVYKNVIVATNYSSKVQKIYLAHKYGLVSFQQDDFLYELIR